MEEAAKAYGTDFYIMDTERLEKEGVILRFGMTPTDMMHVRGDYTEYDTESAGAACDWLARYLHISRDALLEKIYRKVTLRLYCNLVRILLENGSDTYADGVPEAVMDFVACTFDRKEFDGVLPKFETALALVGVGAPTHVFLPDVAEKLHARCILPQNARVANALGTLAGRVSATKQAEIKFCTEEGAGYEVFLGTMQVFEECRDAELAAEEYLKAAAGREVIARGGAGNISYVTEHKRVEPKLVYGSFVMGSTVTVTAYAYPPQIQ